MKATCFLTWGFMPLDGVGGRRGIFVFNTPDIEEAKKFVATDPAINGEMVAGKN